MIDFYKFNPLTELGKNAGTLPMGPFLNKTLEQIPEIIKAVQNRESEKEL